MVETCGKHTLALVHHMQHAVLLWNILTLCEYMSQQTRLHSLPVFMEGFAEGCPGPCRHSASTLPRSQSPEPPNIIQDLFTRISFPQLREIFARKDCILLVPSA